MHSHTLEANKLKPLLLSYSLENPHYTSVLPARRTQVCQRKLIAPWLSLFRVDVFVTRSETKALIVTIKLILYTRVFIHEQNIIINKIKQNTIKV